jgi:hypothetical protein
VTYSDLHPIGLRQTAITLAPDYIEREFQHWNLLPLDIPLEQIPLADAEVSGLVEIGLDDAIMLAETGTGTVPARYATRTQTALEYSEATLSTSDLIPNYLKLDRLYLRLFVAAHRFCEGERTHVFW